MNIEVIIPAAGAGQRLGEPIPKAFVELKGKPLVCYALKAFELTPTIKQIILAVPIDYMEKFQALAEEYGISKARVVVPGGMTRQLSVGQALDSVSADADYVLVHDAARPFITAQGIQNFIAKGYGEAAAVLAVPVKSTVKRSNSQGYVEETLERNQLWEIQTPQMFRADVLRRAHTQAPDANASDDAVLVERLGERVKIIEGHDGNIKITTPEDLRWAEWVIEQKKVMDTI